MSQIHNDDDALVGCGGGGNYIFWQLGAARAVLEQRVGLKTRWTGASSGAICAALILCEVDDSLTMETAASVQKKHGVYARSAGLLGIWGYCVREMLEQLLPENAAEICNSSLTIRLTVWRGWKLRWNVERISYFIDRSYLIDAILASCHVPWAFTGTPFTRICLENEKTKPVCDGCVGWWLPARNIFGIQRKDLKLIGENGEKVAYHITQMKDKEYRRNGPHFASVLSYKAMISMRERGYVFTQKDLIKKKSCTLNSMVTTTM